jgi:hypothetical protein
MTSSTATTMTQHVHNWYSEIYDYPGALDAGIVDRFRSTMAGHYTQVLRAMGICCVFIDIYS